MKRTAQLLVKRANKRILVADGADKRTLVLDGADKRSLVAYGADKRTLVANGADKRPMQPRTSDAAPPTKTTRATWMFEKTFRDYPYDSALASAHKSDDSPCMQLNQPNICQ